MTEHTLSPDRFHCVLDNSLPPAIEIDPGDIVHCYAREVSNGQITPDSTAEAVDRADADIFYPLAGPISVKGAEPGDALEIEVLATRPDPWGWTGIFRDFGLLAADFPEPYLVHWDLSNGRRASFVNGIEVPLRPYCGTMGVAPAEPGPHPAAIPGYFGGNIDIRQLVTGSKLLLPVNVAGGLFSAGDSHAAQGDGEVCGTGIECGMSFSLRFELIRGLCLPAPQYTLGPGQIGESDATGYFVTTGVGPDLMENARDAVRRMIDWLERKHSLSRPDGYVLCSVAADLKISEIVDEPNWIVSCFMPLSIFGKGA